MKSTTTTPTELFVYCNWFSRGEEGIVKFRADKADVEEAISLRAASDKEKEDFLDRMNTKFTGVWDSLLFSALIFDSEDPLTAEGLGVLHEEAEFGIGPTKNAARVAYTKIHVVEEDDSGDEDW